MDVEERTNPTGLLIYLSNTPNNSLRKPVTLKRKENMNKKKNTHRCLILCLTRTERIGKHSKCQHHKNLEEKKRTGKINIPSIKPN